METHAFSGPPSTHVSLLSRLRDLQSQEAWNAFVARYGPYVYGVLRRNGFAEHDALDLVQEMFCAVVDRIGEFEYEFGKGRFHNWLVTIAMRLGWKQRYRGRQPVAVGGSAALGALNEAPDRNADLTNEDEKAARLELLSIALEKTRVAVPAEFWTAFTLTALEGRDAAEVAGIQQVSRACVNTRAFRVRRVLKQFLGELEGNDEPVAA